jgi:D-glycero-D-manno-heptose 1,7-bisphosphate phosphatase
MSGVDMHPAVFLDRDGTLIEDCGDLRDTSQIIFFPETINALQRLQEYYLLFIVTNQPGIARGTVTRDEVDIVNASVVSHLSKAGIHIKATYVCPHQRTNGCHCIKPNPYFLLQAQSEHSIDLRRSFVIGDHPHDVELATNAGAQGIYVLTGHGAHHREELPSNTIVAPGIQEASQHILQTLNDARDIKKIL